MAQTEIGRQTAITDSSAGDWARQIAVVCATLVVLAVNFAANALPLNGQTTGEISDRFDVLIIPAGYVFSIWGLIYLFAVGYTVFHSLPAQRASILMRRTGYLYVVTCAANAGWIFLWHYSQVGLSVIVMVALLITLLMIYVRTAHLALRGSERWLVQPFFSIYLGWISVATIVNISTFLVAIGWSAWGLSAQTWCIFMLGIGGGLGFMFGLRFRDWAYVAVLSWAVAGIAVGNAGVPMVPFFAAGIALALALLVGYVWIRDGFVLNPKVA